MADDEVDIRLRGEADELVRAAVAGGQAITGLRTEVDQLNAALNRTGGNLPRAVGEIRNLANATRDAQSAVRSLVSTQQQPIGTAETANFLSFGQLDAARRNTLRAPTDVERTQVSTQQQPIGQTITTPARSAVSFSDLGSIGRVIEQMRRDTEAQAPQVGVGLVRAINRGMEVEARNVTAFQRMVRQFGEQAQTEVMAAAPRMDVGLHRAIQRQAEIRRRSEVVPEEPPRPTTVESGLVSAGGVPLGTATRTVPQSFISPGALAGAGRVTEEMRKRIEEDAPRVSVALQRTVQRANEEAAKEAERSAPRMDVGLHRAVEKQADERRKASEAAIKRTKELLDKAEAETVENAPRMDVGLKRAVERQAEEKAAAEEKERIRQQSASLKGWNFLGLNRIGSLELTAAGVNTGQALAAGMNPAHVAVMEGAQVAGALVQGGFFSKDNAAFSMVAEAMKALPLPIQLMIGAITAATVALGTLAVRSYMVSESVQGTRGSLALRGLGQESVSSEASIRQERTSLQNQFRFLGQGETSDLVAMLNRAPPEVQEFRGRLQQLPVALATTENTDRDDATKLIGQAAERGVAGLLKLTETLNVGDAVWRENISAIIASQDPEKLKGAVDQLVTALEGRTRPGMEAARSDPTAWFPGIPKLGVAITSDAPARNLTNFLLYGTGPVNPQLATPRVDPQIAGGLAVATQLTPEVRQRETLQQQYDSMLRTESAVLKNIQAQSGGFVSATPEARQNIDRLNRADAGVRNVEGMDRPKGVAETRQDAATLTRLQSEFAQAQEAASFDISQAEKVKVARAAIDAEITRQHAAAVELQKGSSRELSAAEVQSAEQTRQQLIQIERDKVTVRLATSALERARIGPANLGAQVETMRQDFAVVENNRAIPQTQRLAEAAQLETAERQLRLEAEQLNIASLEYNRIIADATGELREQLRIQHDINNVIQGSKDRSPEQQKASEIQTRQREVAATQRELSREEMRSGVNRAENPVDLAYQRISLEADLNRLIASGLSTEEQRLAKINEIVNARRAERLEAENVNIGVLRQNELLLQAQGNLAAIVDLRRQEASIIESSPDRSQADKVAARTQLLQSQIQAQREAQRLEAQFAESMNRADDRRARTGGAVLDLGLATGELRSWQTIPEEQRSNREVTDVKAGRLQTLAQDPNLAPAERARINDQLAELYEADAQKQIDLQSKLTSAIRAENERRVENFKSFFKTVEGGFSDLITTALTEPGKTAEAFRGFVKDTEKSFIKELTNMGSKAIGSALAPSLGVKLKEGEDTSISSVLAKGLGSALGLTIPESKLDQSAVATRMQQAGDAQKQAADIMLQAAKELRGKAGEAPYNAGRGSQLSPGASVPRTGLPPIGGTEDSRDYARRTGLSRTGADAGRTITSTLKERGWSDAAIAGALNNGMGESSLDTSKIGAAGERGVFQFHPKSHIGPFEKQYGGDWSVRAQTEYMAKVVESDPAMAGYTRSTDDRQATRDFLRGFEKPKNQSEDQVSARFTNNAASRNIISGGSQQLSGVEDRTAQAGFGTQFGERSSTEGIVLHHTASRGSIDDVIKTFQERNLPAHYVVGREGQIAQTLPANAQGQHIRKGEGAGRGLSNANTVGVEVVANDDRDVLPVQRDAAAHLSQQLAAQYRLDPKTQVFGHGEINPHKQETEGVTIAEAVRRGSSTASVLPPPAVVPQPALPTVAGIRLPSLIPSAQAAAPVVNGVVVPPPPRYLGVGDSIAAHLIRSRGGAVAGQEDRTTVGNFRPGDTAVSGFSPRGPGALPGSYTPESVLGVIDAIPKERVRGQNVVLSSGVSNNPAQIDSVGQEIASLKEKGAASVTLLGVGTNAKLDGVNEKLAKIAEENKVAFTGPLRKVADDGIHSSDTGDLLRQVREARPKAETITPVTATTTAPAATVATPTSVKSTYYAPEMEDYAPPKRAETYPKSYYYAPEMDNLPDARAEARRLAPPIYPSSVNYAPNMSDPRTSSIVPEAGTALTQGGDSIRSGGTELSTAARQLMDAAAALKAAAPGTTTPTTATPNAPGSATTETTNSSAAPNAGSTKTTEGFSLSNGLGVLGDTANVANSASQLFGIKQSPLMSSITGGLGLISSLTKLGSGLFGASGLFSGATAAAGAATTGAAAGGGGLLSGLTSFLPLLALSKGGVIPAAANGWVVPAAQAGMKLPTAFGQDQVLSALRPQEMVLPVGERPSTINEGLSLKFNQLEQRVARTFNVPAASEGMVVPAASGGGILGSILSFIGGPASWVLGNEPDEAIAGQLGSIFKKKGAIPAASGGWVVPAAASGWQLSPSFGRDSVLSALSPGETVLPGSEKPSTIADRMASQFDKLAGSGGDTHHNYFNVSALDGRSVAQLIASQPDAVAAALNRSRRSFNPNAR